MIILFAQHGNHHQVNVWHFVFSLFPLCIMFVHSEWLREWEWAHDNLLIYQPVLVAISPVCPHSEVVDKDFMAACYYLKDRRNEVDNPNKEMVRNCTDLVMHMLSRFNLPLLKMNSTNCDQTMEHTCTLCVCVCVCVCVYLVTLVVYLYIVCVCVCAHVKATPNPSRTQIKPVSKERRNHRLLKCFTRFTI